jgi:hypothetical protein
LLALSIAELAHAATEAEADDADEAAFDAIALNF